MRRKWRKKTQIEQRLMYEKTCGCRFSGIELKITVLKLQYTATSVPFLTFTSAVINFRTEEKYVATAVQVSPCNINKSLNTVKKSIQKKRIVNGTERNGQSKRTVQARSREGEKEWERKRQNELCSEKRYFSNNNISNNNMHNIHKWYNMRSFNTHTNTHPCTNSYTTIHYVLHAILWILLDWINVCIVYSCNGTQCVYTAVLSHSLYDFYAVTCC